MSNAITLIVVFLLLLFSAVTNINLTLTNSLLKLEIKKLKQEEEQGLEKIISMQDNVSSRDKLIAEYMKLLPNETKGVTNELGSNMVSN